MLNRMVNRMITPTPSLHAHCKQVKSLTTLHTSARSGNPPMQGTQTTPSLHAICSQTLSVLQLPPVCNDYRNITKDRLAQKGALGPPAHKQQGRLVQDGEDLEQGVTRKRGAQIHQRPCGRAFWFRV